MTALGRSIVLVLFSAFSILVHADQGSFANSGGSTSVSSGVTINSTVASPAGSLSVHCPTASAGSCAGGNFSFFSTDGTVSLTASFTSGRFAESWYGGGRGGHITCTAAPDN